MQDTLEVTKNAKPFIFEFALQKACIKRM